MCGWSPTTHTSTSRLLGSTHIPWILSWQPEKSLLTHQLDMNIVPMSLMHIHSPLPPIHLMFSQWSIIMWAETPSSEACTRNLFHTTHMRPALQLSQHKGILHLIPHHLSPKTQQPFQIKHQTTMTSRLMKHNASTCSDMRKYIIIK